MAKKAQAIENIVVNIANGAFGKGDNWNRKAAVDALIDAGVNVWSVNSQNSNLLSQAALDFVNAAKSGNLEKFLDDFLNEKYGGKQATNSNNNSNNYGQTGGQTFGLGDHGYEDVFGNTSYSDGYHVDFWGNWVPNSFGGNYNDGMLFSGNNGPRGGGSGSHY